MKKLMLICSLACVFLLGANSASAQYVSSEQAVLIIKNELASLEQPTSVSNGTFGTSASSTVSVDVKMKTVFLETVLENLSASSSSEVQGAIDATYESALPSAQANADRLAKLNSVKDFTEALLAD